MAKRGVRDTDMGFDKVMSLMSMMAKSKPSVIVGVTGSPAVAAHRDAGGMTVVEIAATHEFGAGVPRRSFIRDAIDEKRDAYKRGYVAAVERAMAAAARQRGGKKKNAAKAARNAAAKENDVLRKELAKLGLRVEGDIKQRIASGIQPANAPATIAAKKSSTPLIDKGQLRASITSQVRSGAQVKS